MTGQAAVFVAGVILGATIVLLAYIAGRRP